VPVNAAAVAGGGFTSGGTVVAPDGDQPVLAGGVLLLEDFRGDGEIAVRVEQIARVTVAMGLVAEIDLAKAGVDPIGRSPGQRSIQACAGLGSRGVAFGFCPRR
jgi:hypothetical protein